ncbi:hypothetical protein [Nonomuraea recticatena]|uniref:Uncharacterized protein n=1 Tax=Nonomuraea recticatena TaxID=46178 RepID=A0ABP6FQ18_9ACTN
MTPQSDEDEVWRQIVASYNQPDSAEQPWPDSENLSLEEPEPEPTRRVVKASEFEDDESEPEPEQEEDEEGHYVPEPPPPLPKVDLTTKLAWVALFGGPAYLLVAAMSGWDMQGWALFTAVAAFIGGFVALVVRMGDGPPNDSGWDDGAVI